MGGPQRGFPTTHWTSILQPADSRVQLERLISRYWKPVYLYIRRMRNRGVEDAKDLTQAFFARLLDQDRLQELSPERGSFRSYLRQAIRNFVIDSARHENARKPRGGKALFPIDEVRDEPVSVERPEEQFQKDWSSVVLKSALDEVEERLRQRGMSPYSEVFVAYYLSRERPTHQELAEKLGTSESSIRRKLTYCLRLLRTALRQRIQEYASTDEERDSELKDILEE